MQQYDAIGKISTEKKEDKKKTQTQVNVRQFNLSTSWQHDKFECSCLLFDINPARINVIVGKTWMNLLYKIEISFNEFEAIAF